MVYTVGEISKLLGIPSSTIRFYDKEGLLPFVERSEGGIRVFKESDIESLRIIHCLKQSGLKIKDIRRFIQMVVQGDESIDERLRLFETQRELVKKQIEEMHEILDTLEFKCWYYKTAQKAGSTAALDNMSADKVPPRFRATVQRLQYQKNTQ